MKFTKMQGCGNDYVYVNLFEEQVEDPAGLARMVSDRHFGVGSDGLILIAPSDMADCRMIMYNADGSQGEMCGNGIRCVAKYAYDHGIVRKPEITVETGAGVKSLVLQVENGKAVSVRVDMGEPILDPDRIPVRAGEERAVDVPVTTVEADGSAKEWRMTCVSMGNPHAVIFVDDVGSFPLEHYGPLFESHELFPNRVNTEFVQVLSREEVSMRVWERGSGETLACGTGACASVMACILNGKTGNRVRIHLLGGDLFIEYDEETNHIFMTGPAVEVFGGELP